MCPKRAIKEVFEKIRFDKYSVDDFQNYASELIGEYGHLCPIDIADYIHLHVEGYSLYRTEFMTATLYEPINKCWFKLKLTEYGYANLFKKDKKPFMFKIGLHCK